MQNLRWKFITIVVVFIVFFGLGVYPIISAYSHLPMPKWLADHQLRLGLDLKGGVHLVLRVQTDDALRVQTEQEMSRVQQELKTRNVPATATIVDALERLAQQLPDFHLLERVRACDPPSSFARLQAACRVERGYPRIERARRFSGAARSMNERRLHREPVQ